jgi:cellulose synthase/poly-beta-1,6-N-acetylglucosamine synthase-like glycosyltransferase
MPPAPSTARRAVQSPARAPLDMSVGPGEPAQGAPPAARHVLVTLAILAAAAAIAAPTTLHAPLAAGQPLLFVLNAVLLPFWLGCFAFPVLHLVRNLAHFYGSLGPARRNSRRLVCTPRAPIPPEAWPSVSILVPVYCESFTEVIRPTLERALRAARGRARVIVFDDGLDVLAAGDLAGLIGRLAAAERTHGLSREERQAAERLAFYRERGVGFIARSRAGRVGLFKKASNLNDGMNLADAVEARLTTLAPEARDAAYPRALREALATWPRTTWAEGDIRLGELLVILDKDSEMPEGVIEATLPEFLADERLGYTQHRTRVVNTGDGFFARWLGRFTEQLFFVSFPLSAASGEMPPLVGHNAFLRTAALRAVARTRPGWTQYWGERVSEDLELAMRLVSAGWLGRYVAFPGLDFGERVTRTYAEEARRFHKFAFGAAELMFNPIPEMAARGVLTPTFRGFLASPRVAWHDKVAIVVYLMSYWALAFPFLALPALGAALAAGAAWRHVAFSTVWTVVLCLFVFLVVSGMVNQHVRNDLAASGGGLTPTGAREELRSSLFLVALHSALAWPSVTGLLAHLLGRRPQFCATNMDALAAASWPRLLRELWREHARQLLASASVLVLLVALELFASQRLGVHAWFGFCVIAASHIAVPHALNPILVERVAAGARGVLERVRDGIAADPAR